jgi:hypothetical protein
LTIRKQLVWKNSDLAADDRLALRIQIWRTDMNFLKIAVVATAITALSTASFAGGLANEIMEAPVVMEEEMMAPATGSISPTIIVVGVLAALLLAATLQEDDDEPTSEPPVVEPPVNGPT